MQLKSTYFGGVLIKNGIRTNIALGNYLVSDAEMNQPKGLFKKPIKDSEKEYNILNTISNCKVIGFTHFCKGWSHHGYYNLPDNFLFLPVDFLNIAGDNKYGGAFLPKVYSSKKWHLDFYKVEVVSNGIIRTLRYTIYGNRWVYQKGDDGKPIDASNLSLFDSNAKEVIASFAGQLEYIHESGSWKKNVLSVLKGYHPCFIRDDIDGPFVIEFQDRAL